MGVRPLDGWPDLFVKAVGNLQKGQVSALIQSGNGFHIIRCWTAAPPAGSGPHRPRARACPTPQPKSQPQRAHRHPRRSRKPARATS